MRRTFLLVVLLALIAPILAHAGPAASAAENVVTGNVTSKEKIALSPDAVTVVTLVDQQADPTTKVAIGQQVITGGQFPIAFSVPFEAAAIDPTHSYALFASTLDAGKTRQTVEAVPVITGGPTSNVVLPVVITSPGATASVTGTITKADKAALTPEAVAYAILVNTNTGTLTARQVIPAPGATPVAFSIAYDPGIIDPAATYVVKAMIIDGSSAWEARTGVPAVTNGAPSEGLVVAVTIAGGPQPTAAPTAKPTAAPTAKPTAAPTEAPTAAPTEAPTEAPTAAPSDEPTSSPSEVPSESATASPTAEPTTGTIKGTLTWNEDHKPTAEAHAVVLLVEGTAGPKAGTIIASKQMTDPGDQPIPWELAYAFSALTKDATYRLYAGLVDGDLAWVTPIGVPVETGVALVEGVELPLAFRPDLLKGAVTGTISGIGLDSASDPETYGTALVIKVSSGETIGFQYIQPTGAAPVAYSVPYDPEAIDDDADYVVRGTIWENGTLWATEVGTPVITKGNGRSDIPLTVTVVSSPSPTPTAAPTPAPEPPVESG